MPKKHFTAAMFAFLRELEANNHKTWWFSRDKTRYKVNVGIQFRHEEGKDIHAPGFYLHLEPGSCFAGVGLWHPETVVARAIRQAIHDDPEGWANATKHEGFTDTWSMHADDDEMLNGFPPGSTRPTPTPTTCG